MHYTLIAGSSGIEIVVLVLDIIDHKNAKKNLMEVKGKSLPEDCRFREI